MTFITVGLISASKCFVKDRALKYEQTYLLSSWKYFFIWQDLRKVSYF